MSFVSHDFGDPLPLGAFWRGWSRTGRVLAVFRFCRLEWACKRFRDAKGSCGPGGGFPCELWRGENRGLGLADQACSERVQRVRGVKPAFLPGSVSPAGA